MNRFFVKRTLWPGLLFLILCLTASCASPFADAASTKGPGLNVTSGVGKISVSWNPVLGASGYHLEWSTAADFTGARAVDPATSPASFDGTVPGTSYYVRARANLKSGPSSWSTATVPVTGWTWSRSPESIGTPQTFTSVQTIDVGGSTLAVSTTYTLSLARLETLTYSAAGVTRSTKVRTTTTFSGVPGSTESNTTPVEVTGTWDPGKLWQSLTLGSAPSLLISDLSVDRASFTFDGAVWTLIP